MNFLDPYDVATRTDTPPVTQPEKSLNDEVTEVIGQLGSFWGGFRKQSQIAINAARKDLSQVVTNAQKELGKLTAETPQDSSSRPTVESAGSDGALTPEAQSETSEDHTAADDSTTPTADRRSLEIPSVSAGLSNLFTRLQSTIPPNVVSAVQNNLPESIKHATTEGVDFTQLRSTISAELQRVQGVTRAQAEDYVHRSEAFLKDAMKEAQVALKDAVKVIPPEDVSSSTEAVWDGSDVWLLPSGLHISGSANKGKTREEGSSSMTEAQRSVATRAEALLKTLKHNSEIILHDPETDDIVKGVYHQWLEEEGSNYSDTIIPWITKGEEVLKDPVDGQALQATHDQIVPSTISEEEFWKRYFFRVHQIERDEQKRKTLLENTVDNEDNFSWEDDDDEAPTQSQSSVANSVAKTPGERETNTSGETKASLTPANTSPRASSDESYDVVSSRNSVSGEPTKPTSPKETTVDEEEEDGDSDWE